MKKNRDSNFSLFRLYCIGTRTIKKDVLDNMIDDLDFYLLLLIFLIFNNLKYIEATFYYFEYVSL